MATTKLDYESTSIWEGKVKTNKKLRMLAAKKEIVIISFGRFGVHLNVPGI